jgi:cold shock CspA family protein
MNKGQLKSWDDSRGFGFIKSDSLNRDIFIHISTLKSMSRKPKVGDFIYFEVQKQADGKDRAINCRIEGVIAINPNQISKKPKSNFIGNLFSVVVFLGIANFIYAKVNDANVDKVEKPEFINSTPIIFEQPKFRCDGRQHCSQMTSRAEANYFTANCPNTKMDGDNDGVPCENDTRF